MKETIDISVILPVHEFDEVTKQYFANAIKSVEQQIVLPKELIIVVPKGSEAETYVKSYDFGTIAYLVSIVENQGATDFCSQINYGASVSTAEWFSILEYDDQYAKNWFKNVGIYQKAYPTVDIFLPLIVDTNGNDEFIGFTNEAVWANSFSDELGFLDLNSLLNYQNFSADGFVMRTSTFLENGQLKSSIKLTFIYEFLLRMTFKDIKVMVIPKFGYKHINQRAGSLFASYKDTLNPAESKYWLNAAKKEYYFDNDRKITYKEQN